PDAAGNQAAAVAKAVAEPAGNTAQNTSQLASPQALSLNASQAVQAPATTTATNTASAGTTTSLKNIFGDPTFNTIVFKQTSGLGYFSNGLAQFSSSIAQQLTFGPGGSTAGAGGAWYPTPQFASLGLGNLGGGGVGHLSGVTASAGQAARIGTLSVPQHWATLTSAVSPATVSEMDATPVQAAATGTTGPANGLLRGMPAGALGRRGATAGYVNKYGFRYSVLTRPPSAG
ncbi:PE/PPE C-terminal domain-containing protein, partial [Mycobacterium marseillense]